MKAAVQPEDIAMISTATLRYGAIMQLTLRT